jgi:uracil phosphoribosyltransferase
MVHILGLTNSILNNFVLEIRDEVIQKDSLRFRRNLERIGEIVGYEISKSLQYELVSVQTPLGISQINKLKDEVVVSTILRAGLPLHQGLMNYFDGSESAFVSAFRKHRNEEEFDVFVEYCAAPNLNGKVLIIADPMIATGVSMELAIKALLKNGKPKKIIIVSAIASSEAISYLKSNLPTNTTIWVCAIDSELTAQSYIVPGLGDAGDLSFGVKL